ncbi:sugar phosphate isomerase/epimerase family protein [Pseudomonas guariconensis]|uniref:sugar phosphate isomerase/epimerase family protein n=1 Tax=Pseudomonas guariconensis TaxID=1288410 RepID=UPI0018A8AFED|nr:AP endonuclease [Pseudomonas guariconensis]MBF8743446.1 AP endonuclease [Pseudomonas guariconensis]MBF8751800.1 AP endonuclease [Pseudomonas guariconensis]MBF8794335.1 AP endonuclease [Pseudomonas monteilii]
MHANPVSISLSSFGADTVKRRGQVAYLPLLAQAGACRVEWREELFDTWPDADALAKASVELGLESLFSTPLELWREDGSLEPAVAERLHLAERIGAVALKVSLGHYRDTCDLHALRPLLGRRTALFVENDQTVQGGRLEPLRQFFERAAALDLAPGMTFDIGNWYWQGESPVQAAQALGRWVQYVHCKAVTRRDDGRQVAVPPQASDLAAWRQLMTHFMPGVPRAIEYPLVADDLLGYTRQQVQHLAVLEVQVRHG